MSFLKSDRDPRDRGEFTSGGTPAGDTHAAQTQAGYSQAALTQAPPTQATSASDKPTERVVPSRPPTAATIASAIAGGDLLDLAVGTMLGKYRIEDRLGLGGMGVVYRAVDTRLDRTVALKLMKPELAREKGFRERFLREARAAARINDPHVVTIHDVDEVNGLLYMAFEFVPGGDLSVRIRRDGPLNADEALHVLIGCARGLMAIHRAGLVHRDIKPQNIFIDAQGRAKLGDLGLARSSSGDDRMTVTGAQMGTPAYMSPEQAAGAADVDIRADIHALGGTLYMLLTGQPPYAGPTMWAVVNQVMDLDSPAPDPRTTRHDLSETISKLAMRALSKRREDRHQTPEELIADLQQALGESTQATPGTVLLGGNAALERSAQVRASLKIAKKPAPQSPTAAPARSRMALLIGSLVGLIAVIGLAGYVLGGGGGNAGSVQPASDGGRSDPPVAGAGNPGATGPAAPTKAAQPAAIVPPVAPGAQARPVWAAAVGTDAQGTWADLKVGDLTQRWRRIPAGTFTMGSPLSENGRKDDEIVHPVTISKDFWMADSEVTQALWQAVMDSNPSQFTGDLNRPVENVSWVDCLQFIKALNVKAPGLDATFPSEAQWEYACRAGTIGAHTGEPAAVAWFESTSGAQTHPVKAKSPNPWGLYDMHGNVWEWCADWEGDTGTSAQQDPVGPSGGANRILRGGSWLEPAKKCRSANRSGDYPGNRSHDQGLRLAAPAR
ncbi:hypothetical protein LBMAG53_02090 [Planctomycetota bacterium]|nr:hypothetical protein LBMAG53_02090 [Planctomycetota bacterium]